MIHLQRLLEIRAGCSLSSLSLNMYFICRQRDCFYEENSKESKKNSIVLIEFNGVVQAHTKEKSTNHKRKQLHNWTITKFKTCILMQVQYAKNNCISIY